MKGETVRAVLLDRVVLQRDAKASPSTLRRHTAFETGFPFRVLHSGV